MGLRVVTFKLRDEEIEELDMIAAKLRKTRSDIIREAIREYVKGTHIQSKTKIRKVVLDPPPPPPPPSPPKPKPTCEEVKALKERGWSWEVIGEVFGRSGSSMYKWFRRFCREWA